MMPAKAISLAPLTICSLSAASLVALIIIGIITLTTSVEKLLINKNNLDFKNFIISPNTIQVSYYKTREMYNSFLIKKSIVQDLICSVLYKYKRQTKQGIRMSKYTAPGKTGSKIWSETQNKITKINKKSKVRVFTKEEIATYEASLKK